MIYYSHINEDNRIERTILQQAGCASAVAICGSGERVISLMDVPQLKKLVVVDSNEEALYLLRLKLTALTHLPIKDYLAFIGHYPMPGHQRRVLFDRIKVHLPIPDKAYWSGRQKTIQKGILYTGHFERFLHRIRPATRLYLGPGFRQIFSSGYTPASFPETRWQLLQKIFSKKMAYQLAGNRDTAFTGEKALTSLVPAALDRTIKSGKAPSSFMVHLVFNGSLAAMPAPDLPPSLQEQVLTAIKERLQDGTIQCSYVKADILDYVKRSTKQACFFSLSDILSFADFGYLQNLVSACAGHGNTVVGRSFLRNRLTQSQLTILGNQGKLTVHDNEDSTGMYQVFSLNYPS